MTVYKLYPAVRLYSVKTSELLYILIVCQVIINVFGTHMDAATWIDPIVFRPERFLDERGDVTGKHRIIPFSLGMSIFFILTD
jgi:hypothetical protein